MCGRSSLALTEDEVEVFLRTLRVNVRAAWPRPRYNIAPTQDQLVVTERDGERAAQPMRWGLIPSWAKDPSIGNQCINARAETVASKPAYRSAFQRRRCLVVIDGCYEWQRRPTGPKTPMRICHRDRIPFTLAGLWETWGTGDERLVTCTILTTGPNAMMAPIHNRMPVVLTGDARDVWLDASTTATTLESLTAPDETDALEAYEVSALVNSPRNDTHECWTPVL